MSDHGSVQYVSDSLHVFTAWTAPTEPLDLVGMGVWDLEAVRQGSKEGSPYDLLRT